jgi:hypothetical protein
LRAVLAAAFFFGQGAIAFHHHDRAASNTRIAASSRTSVAAFAVSDEDCLLCAAQGMPSSPASAAPAAASLPVEVAALSIPFGGAAPAAPIDRVSDRSPPVL